MPDDEEDVIRRSRFSGGPARSFMSSMDDDERLFEADLAIDRAHVVMLAESGIIPDAVAGRLLHTLDTIEEQGFNELPQGEDIHAAIETAVIGILGAEGGWLHTARSRNDEVATCIRYRLRADLLGVVETLVSIRETILLAATAERETVLPGFTHLQPAQPTTVGHWLSSYEQALARETHRAFDAYSRINQSPLGAAAFAGTTFDIDRHRTASLLGFDGIVENAMDAVSTRDVLLETASLLSSIVVVLSGVATDVTIYANRGFVELDDDFASTSSIMPQKKNPDTMELVRACAGDVIGSHTAMVTTLKGLPRAYNRDLQRVTPHMWEAIDVTSEALSVTEGTVGTMAWDSATLEAAVGEGFTTATAVADTIVRSGVPFRTAHEIVAEMAIDGGETPDIAAIETTVARHVDAENIDLDTDALERALDPSQSVHQLDSTGGAAPHAVEATIERAQARLDEDVARLGAYRTDLTDAQKALKSVVATYV